ncbi:MAG: histone deacetylase family protein [Sulfolobaceae archaeon]
MVPIIFSDIYLYHKPRVNHVENPTRLVRIIKSLELKEIIKPSKVTLKDVEIIHDKEYIELVEASSRYEEWLDDDTYTNSFTIESALYALGGTLKAMELNGFAIVRPPGHHAGKSGRALGAPTLGFCIFNNVAFGIKKSSAKRAVIIDFDVHYGNGTQEIFWDDPNVVHIDIHQDPMTLYPGTGFPEMIGGEGAEGTKINLILPPLSSDDVYLELIPIIQEIIDDFKPDIIAYSAGFDAFEGDGLADIMATEATYYHLGLISKGYKRFAVLEGGYSSGLERGVRAFIDGLDGLDKDYKPKSTKESVKSIFREYLKTEKDILKKYWKIT